MNSITDKLERYDFHELSQGSVQFKIQYSERVHWRRNPIMCRPTSHRTATANVCLLARNPFSWSRYCSSHSSDRLFFKAYCHRSPSASSHDPVRDIANRLSFWHKHEYIDRTASIYSAGALFEPRQRYGISRHVFRCLLQSFRANAEEAPRNLIFVPFNTYSFHSVHYNWISTVLTNTCTQLS